MPTVAIIPARAGSRGLKRKHLRLLGGVPLIAHTVRAALLARRIDRVVVSTDDPAIAREARRAGAEVPYLRPAALARDGTPTAPVIEHAVAWLEDRGDTVDIVVTLQPTTPLRDAAEIDAVLALLDGDGVQSAVSVTPIGHAASTIGWLADGRLVRTWTGDDARRQAAPEAVRITGGVYATRREVLRSGRLLDDSPAAHLVRGPTAIDIDTPADLTRARRALRASARRPAPSEGG